MSAVEDRAVTPPPGTMARPKRIYLQGFCSECGDPPSDETITWCEDDIGCSECGAGDLPFVAESEGVVVEVRHTDGDSGWPELVVDMVPDDLMPFGESRTYRLTRIEGEV